jgi:hypothetical protein
VNNAVRFYVIEVRDEWRDTCVFDLSDYDRVH